MKSQKECYKSYIPLNPPWNRSSPEGGTSAPKTVSCQKKKTIREKPDKDTRAAKSQPIQFKKKYRLWEIQPILDELDCQVIRHPESGYLLVDRQGDVNSGIRFPTYRDIVVWACSDSPEHPLASGIVD